MPPKEKVPKRRAPGKSVPHGEEFDAPFIPSASATLVIPSPAFRPDVANLNEAVLLNRVVELEAAHRELACDLVRIVELIIKGDIDSSKFKEILTKRQGIVKP